MKGLYEMNQNSPTKRQENHAKKAAAFLLDEKMPLYSLQWLASIDPVFYRWLAIEQIEYKRLGGEYGENESDELHNKAGDYALYLIEIAYKVEKKNRRVNRK